MNIETPKTTRIYFKTNHDGIYEKEVTFDFYSGFSLSQKQKTIKSFHEKIKDIEGNNVRILEVSRKSEDILGKALSAFNLKYNNFSVESIYQSSKVFSDNTQLRSLLYSEPLEAKREANDYQINNNVHITQFNFFGEMIPTFPESLFYDYLYIKAIMQNKLLANELLKYSCFTDIEFNQKKQVSSQARSCAIFVFLSINNLLSEYLESIETFRKVYESIIKKDFNLLSI